MWAGAGAGARRERRARRGRGVRGGGAGRRRGVRCVVLGWVTGRRRRGDFVTGEPRQDAWRGWVPRRDGWRGTPLPRQQGLGPPPPRGCPYPAAMHGGVQCICPAMHGGGAKRPRFTNTLQTGLNLEFDSNLG